MNINRLEKDSDVIFIGMLNSLFAGITGKQNRRNVGIILARRVDHFKPCVLLLQRIVAKQQVELMLPQHPQGLS